MLAQVQLGTGKHWDEMQGSFPRLQRAHGTSCFHPLRCTRQICGTAGHHPSPKPAHEAPIPVPPAGGSWEKVVLSQMWAAVAGRSEARGGGKAGGRGGLALRGGQELHIWGCTSGELRQEGHLTRGLCLAFKPTAGNPRQRRVFYSLLRCKTPTGVSTTTPGGVSKATTSQWCWVVAEVRTTSSLSRGAGPRNVWSRLGVGLLTRRGGGPCWQEPLGCGALAPQGFLLPKGFFACKGYMCPLHPASRGNAGSVIYGHGTRVPHLPPSPGAFPPGWLRVCETLPWGLQSSWRRKLE